MDDHLRNLTFPPEPSEAHVDDGHLLAYRSGQIAPAEAKRIEAHLARCGECRSLLVALAEPDEGPELRWPTPRRRSAGAWAVGLGGAAAAAALALTLSLEPGYRRPEVGALSLEPLSGSTTRQRGDTPAGEIALFTDETRVVGLLRATKPRAPEGETVSLFVESADGRLERVKDAALRVTPSGGYEVSAPAASVFAEDGRYRIHFVVHAAELSVGELRAFEDLERRARVFSRDVRFRRAP